MARVMGKGGGRSTPSVKQAGARENGRLGGRPRKAAAREMDALRASMSKVSSDEVAKWIREDREQGH